MTTTCASATAGVEDPGSTPGLGKVPSLPDLCNMKASLALAESLARASLMTSPAAKRRLQARRLELGLGEHPGYVPPKHLLLYLVRMGSFNSAPKILNEDNQDNDLDLPERMSHEELLAHCRKDLEDSPLVSRNFVNVRPPRKDNATNTASKLRILQWNLLSQALGETVDNFVACPDAALNWRRRRQQLSEEIVRYQPDIICLQEVDHYNYFQKTLSTQGFKGIFFPKPDSPCIYIKDNNGPDGCAIFYREDRFQLILSANRILEVWRVQSNQVAVLAVLRELETGEEICVATTHLKARSGALLSTLRNEQGKDLLEFVVANAGGRPVILCGDFNAEPTEPIYSTVLGHDLLQLASAYRYPTGEEPPYTTWKIREDGEVRHTIDYVFYTQERFEVDALLEFPTGEEIGEGRVPSLNYPSDHFSLVCDLTLTKSEEKDSQSSCSL